MARARGVAALTPAQFRNCLRTTGTPQQDEAGRPASQRIGNRPNLRQLAVCAFGKGKEIAKEVIKEGKDGFKEGKEIRKEVVKEGKEAFKDLPQTYPSARSMIERYSSMCSFDGMRSLVGVAMKEAASTLNADTAQTDPKLDNTTVTDPKKGKPNTSGAPETVEAAAARASSAVRSLANVPKD